MTTATALPRWDLTPAFASPDAPELDAAVAEIRSGLAALDGIVDREAGDQTGLVEELLRSWEAIQRRLALVSSFLFAWNSTDTTDPVSGRKLGELYELQAEVAVVRVRVLARLGAVDVDAVVERSQLARDHEHFLRTTAVDATHLMSYPEEELAARLRPGAGAAWERLRDDVSTTLAATFELEGEERERPIAEILNLASHPDREVRRRAYETEDALWRQAAVPIAASLNGIKNEAITLSDRRGWADPLDIALHQNAIDRDILDTMIVAMEGCYDELRGHLRRKARVMGLDRLAWYDLQAPLGAERTTFDFDEARTLLTRSLSPLSPRLADMIERAFDERWIDAEPRAGKYGGGFCTEIFPHGPRILVNYDGSLHAVSVLAHELGHAFHDVSLAERTQLQRPLPMTLAETASMFLQHMLEDAMLERAPEEERLSILNTRLNEAAAILFDLRSRFEFERRVFERRRERALSVDELHTMTLEAQTMAYGDAVDPELLAPTRWAARSHYYIVDLGYYNFPYQFGMLFALGLYREYQTNPDGFAERYERLLSRTGMASAAELAAEFGIDLRDEAFWSSSLDVVREDIRRFAELTPGADA